MHGSNDSGGSASSPLPAPAERLAAVEKVITRSRQNRAKATNGKSMIPSVDGRLPWVRRLRDIFELHVADLGGESVISEAERSIVRRAATLTVELERLEARFANDTAADGALDQYQRGANSLRRLLESVGLERRARDVTVPTLAEYLAKDETPPG